jgi:hypothetical protein
LVHIEDISRAFLAVLKAPRDLVHNQAFNVGLSSENYQIRDLADMVQQIVPGSHVKYAEGGGPDPRCYKVDCGKIAAMLPEFKPAWTVRRGMEQLYAAFRTYGLTREDFVGGKFLRIKHISKLMEQHLLTSELRWSNDHLGAQQAQPTEKPAAVNGGSRG